MNSVAAGNIVTRREACSCILQDDEVSVVERGDIIQVPYTWWPRKIARYISCRWDARLPRVRIACPRLAPYIPKVNSEEQKREMLTKTNSMSMHVLASLVSLRIWMLNDLVTLPCEESWTLLFIRFDNARESETDR